ncbi:arsenate reductase family protein [Aneurinibacillus aneurinilyticus]|jgi:arsenate reductase|uniref:Arsenate reductase family protein n=1 Tax=Aneurinibacillus aneurinilyticus TaxID=1391 RepID=A0A848CRM1_ANEAE|nr:arsenate reductase family protein [Aneurinibacillus aneurinilyticus]MCI1694512.1 arsenate reductase family protein [Aneurinibacillus aneurinilyticus]MED0670877.1 arsenate reductase family protein [Aneurinibacillus aneurinilyticus]NME98473.1 arsenate reductase family protein [Aneurinibacillus aneurinilyticus]
MADITAYLYNKCGTCRKAKKWLEEQGIAYCEVPIVDSPPEKEQLRTYWQQSGLELKKFFNTSGQSYRELGLKDRLKDMSEEEMLDLLATDGKLIKRPLIAAEGKVTVGFKEEEMEKTWK